MHPNQDSTWGRHLLQGVAPEARMEEVRRLRGTFHAVLARESLAAYRWGHRGPGAGMGLFKPPRARHVQISL
jgi:hypothetical protein